MLPNQYWREKDWIAVQRARTYSQLAKVAIRVLTRMPHPIGQVCGPITSGGMGSQEKNTEIFAAAIKRLQSEGRIIFDQLPFEPALQRIYQLSNASNPGIELLEKFYFPIFVSGLVKWLYFLPNWATSVGASWEHATALNLDILYEILPLDYLTLPANS